MTRVSHNFGHDGNGVQDKTDPQAEAVEAETIAAEIEKSRSDVLDLTLRNPLLNFRPSKRRGLHVVDERSRELFRILVQRERPMFFLPAPDNASPTDQSRTANPANRSSDELADIPPELLALLAERADDADETAARHTDNRLQTALTRAALNLRLRETFRQARLSIEEQGVNILYLALGMLRWYESDNSEAERLAPLILVPVRLARSDIRESFKLTWTKDEIEANLSLASKLSVDFGVRLPEMPYKDVLDVDDWLNKVEEAIRQRSRWQIARDEIHLGFFSFAKLLIYKDLEPAAWPENSPPADHPLAQNLFGGDGFANEPESAIHHGAHIDDSDTPLAIERPLQPRRPRIGRT